MSNAFQSAEPWETSTSTLLGAGNHIVKITEAQGSTSSGNHPQIELQMANMDGEIRDWLVITEASVGKVVALAQAAGVDLPADDDIEDGLRLKQTWIDRLVLKQVGIVVRMEPSFKDPEKELPRVQGYVDPARIKGSDIPANGNAFTHPPAKSTSDLPF